MRSRSISFWTRSILSLHLQYWIVRRQTFEKRYGVTESVPMSFEIASQIAGRVTQYFSPNNDLNPIAITYTCQRKRRCTRVRHHTHTLYTDRLRCCSDAAWSPSSAAYVLILFRVFDPESIKRRLVMIHTHTHTQGYDQLPVSCW